MQLQGSYNEYLSFITLLQNINLDYMAMHVYYEFFYVFHVYLIFLVGLEKLFHRGCWTTLQP